MRIALACLLFCLAASAQAAAPPALPIGEAAYRAGDFLGAADSGEREGRAGGLSLSARALLAQCLTEPKQGAAPAWLDRAQRNAQAALAAEPDSVDARLQLALAIGLKARRENLREAMGNDYARTGRKLIEEALARDPRQAWGLALLGGWHLEVLRRGGGLGGRLLGARLKSGLRAFDRARALAPDDPAIALHYGVALLSLDPEKYARPAAAQFAAAAAAPARDAFERHMREEARRLGGVLAAKGPQAAARSVAEMRL